MQNWQTNLIAFILLGAMFAMAVLSVRDDSAIRDELPHITAGYSYLTTADYRINPEHPPLIKDLSALPLLFIKSEINFPKNHACWTDKPNDQWCLGNVFLYESENNADKIIFLSRLPIILLMLLAGFFLFKWTRELAGDKASLITLFLYTFSPNIIAHGRFVTTDLGVTAFIIIAFYAYWWFLQKPCSGRLLVAGFAFFLLQVSKFSAPLLIPVFGLIALLSHMSQRQQKIKQPVFKSFKIAQDHPSLRSRPIWSLAVIIFIGYLLVGAFYQLHLVNMPKTVQHELINTSWAEHEAVTLKSALNWMVEQPVLRPYAQYFLGFAMVASHSIGGHTTYFMGEIGNHWPHYYLITYLLKEPISAQLLLLASLILFIAGAWQFARQKQGFGQKILQLTKNYSVQIGMLAFVLLLLFLGMRSRLQLGIRYILPIFPFLYMFIGWQISKLLESKVKIIAYIILILIIGFQMNSVLKVHPYYLAYYNEYIGRPQNGWKYLVDSNTDWGQDLKRLAQFVKDKKIDHIRVDYFGGGNAAYYLGDKAEIWGYDKGRAKGWFAISASAIQWNSQNEYDMSYKWLTDNYEPVEQIGYSILVFHVD